MEREIRAGVLLAAVVLLAGSAPDALAQASHVFAVGSNEYGQLGIRTDTWSPTPSLISDVTAVAGGEAHSLALKDDGTVWAWGDNGYGQLGDGTTANYRRSSVRVAGLPKGVTAVAAGEFHSLFIMSATSGDLNGDGDVDGNDFAIFLAAFGRSVGQPQFDARCDYDADGTVTLADYQVWLGYYRAFVGNPAAGAPAVPAGDADFDGDVDLADFAAMQECAGGAPERALACVAIFDFDGNGEVDIMDAVEFVAAMGGG